MTACKYKTSDGEHFFKNIDELYEYLKDKPFLNSVEDVIYSLEDTRHTKQYDTLRNLKQLQILGYSSSTYFEEDQGFSGSNGELSISGFLDDSPECMVNGRRVCDPLNKEDFRKFRIKALKDKKVPQATAELQVDREIKSWEIIRKNSEDLHKLVISKYIGGTEESETKRKAQFIEQAKQILSTESPLNNDAILGRLFDQVSKFYQRNVYSGCKVVRGLNITSKLKESDTKLLGHIDYAVVDDKGTLHIYNFKTSSQFIGDWGEEKLKKYRYELAFLKQMLANNGLDIKNIQMNIIPVQLDYNETFDQISEIKLLPEGRNFDFYKDRYVGQPYDNVAKYFIESKSVVSNVTFEQERSSRKILNAIFPTNAVSNDSIQRDVTEWIRRAPSYGEEQPLLISEVFDGDIAYIVTINGEKHYIREFTSKENNRAIRKLVQDYLSILNSDQQEYSNRVANAVQHTFASRLRSWDFGKLKNASYLKNILAPYISYKINKVGEEQEIIEYDWEFIDILVDSNILLFRNKNTGQLDVVTLSSKNLNFVPNFKYGTNILGGYKTDRDFIWKGHYGNIETVRGLVMLNTVYDNLPQDIKLGNIHILSTQGMHRQYHIEHIVREYLPEIFKVTKKYNPEVEINNKLKNGQFVDIFEDLVKQLKNICERRDSMSITLNEIIDKDKLEESATDEQKVAILLSIMESFQQEFPDIAKDAQQSLLGEDAQSNLLAKFYIKLTEAYLWYSHQNPTYEDKLKQYERNMYTAPTVPNANINIIVTNLQTTIDSIASDCDTEYSKNLRSFIMEFYKDAGYTSLENMTIGSQNRLFMNLYQTNNSGKRIFRFKNPYTDNTLKDYEKKFLKKVLFYLNKYNFRNKDYKNFKSENDPDIPKYIESHQEYLNVPLERASNSTRRQRLNIGDRISRMKRIYKVFTKNWGEGIFDEFVNGLTVEEREYYNEGFEDLQLRDPFNRSEEQRESYIAENGEDYFETNVENLLIDRMFHSIQTEKMNRMLLGTKAMLLQLKILGYNSGSEDVFNEEIKYIKDYIGLNVFKRSIIESGLSQKIVGTGRAVRKIVTFMNLAGNLIAGARDVENGFMENYIRTVSGFQTDINKANLTKAYAYVVKEGSLDATKITLLSKLCVRYRLSNTDTARIAERLKTNRQGLSNWDNIAYSTLRSPDFLNRMTLFIARAMQDGVLDAWSVVDGELKYDWKKDKRFSVYADKSKKGTEEYKKQQGLYYLAIKEWNKDHPDNQLQYDEDLPSPYSDQEIVAIKNVANNIYGSYDQSLRSMGEFTAIGCFFAMYTTWMNGIWNNWMMKPGKYNVHKMRTEQDTDENGKLLWLDENGQITTENTGIPCLKYVPVIVQGIMYTLGDSLKILKNDGLKAAIDYIKEDENTVSGLKQFGISSLLAILFLILFKFVLDPAYAETKKGYKDMSTMAIVMSELTFKPIKPATDSLYGPVNIIQYLGENTDPPIYNVPTKFIADSYKTILGDKTVGQLITGNFALARIGKQAANIAAKS